MKISSSSIPSCDNCKHKKHSVFADLRKDEVDQLSTIKSCGFYKKGQILFQEESRIPGVYCIHNGKVKLSRIGVEGKEQIIRFAKTSDMIGYKSMLCDEPLSVTATALDDTSVCFIPKSFIFNTIASNNMFSRKIMEIACHEIGEANKIITNLAQKTVRERLAEVLLILEATFGNNEENYLDIKLTREEIASFVGTATESVIRLLSELKKDEIIELKGKNIRILKPNKLARIGNVYD
ncbi:MAG: Crp/Fnr family transcriptional regulator [Flavobacteriales bacterium]|jgi:CRP-like cAMP-binding protein|nr:Crp/Fnr family transcriptional regulator [Flavobacteriales bacterium]